MRGDFHKSSQCTKSPQITSTRWWPIHHFPISFEALSHLMHCHPFSHHPQPKPFCPGQQVRLTGSWFKAFPDQDPPPSNLRAPNLPASRCHWQSTGFVDVPGSLTVGMSQNPITRYATAVSMLSVAAAALERRVGTTDGGGLRDAGSSSLT